MEDQIQNQSTTEQVEAPSKIVINGQEFDSTEAQELIGLGRKTREYEQKWNTSLDRVWPEYGKSQQTLKQMQSELEQARTQLSQFQVKKEAGTETQTDVAQAKEAARKLGLILNEDLEKSGYIKRDELDSYLEKRESEREAIKNILSTAEKLEKEIDGTDGRPRFNKKAVLAYAQAYGIGDLQKAYEDMHSDSIKTWQDAKIAAEKKPGLKTFQSSPGNKELKSVSVTDDNVNNLLKERLWGSSN